MKRILSFVSQAATMSPPGQAFYAVRKGRIPGIFFKWADCETQVKGFSGASYKKFSTVQEAADFILKPETLSSNSQVKQLKRSHSSSLSDECNNIKQKCFNDVREGNFTGIPFDSKDGIHVYTDGGCFNNGKSGAQAGIGVFWGFGNVNNISERLHGRPTNNRAEIHAAVKAIEIAKERGINNLILHTDSQFLINGITNWIKKWKKNNWTLSTGDPVINKEDFMKLDETLQDINVKWVDQPCVQHCYSGLEVVYYRDGTLLRKPAEVTPYGFRVFGWEGRIGPPIKDPVNFRNEFLSTDCSFYKRHLTM